MLSPFLRDMTYASMFYNLLKKNDNLLEYEYEVENSKTK